MRRKEHGEAYNELEVATKKRQRDKSGFVKENSLKDTLIGDVLHNNVEGIKSRLLKREDRNKKATIEALLGVTPLMVAAGAHNGTEVLKLFFDKRYSPSSFFVDIYAVGMMEHSMLQHAVKNGKVEPLKFMLEKLGVDREEITRKINIDWMLFS